MQTSINLDDFTFYLTDSQSDLDLDNPFHYHVQVTLDDEGYWKSARATCQSIPCEICQFQIKCKDGRHLTAALTEFAVQQFPELQI